MSGWFWIVIIGAAAVLVLVRMGWVLSQSDFRCKRCGKSFRISWRRALWVQHFEKEYILRCPHCGQKGWCMRTASSQKEGD